MAYQFIVVSLLSEYSNPIVSRWRPQIDIHPLYVRRVACEILLCDEDLIFYLTSVLYPESMIDSVCIIMYSGSRFNNGQSHLLVIWLCVLHAVALAQRLIWL